MPLTKNQLEVLVHLMVQTELGPLYPSQMPCSVVASAASGAGAPVSSSISMAPPHATAHTAITARMAFFTKLMGSPVFVWEDPGGSGHLLPPGTSIPDAPRK